MTKRGGKIGSSLLPRKGHIQSPVQRSPPSLPSPTPLIRLAPLLVVAPLRLGRRRVVLEGGDGHTRGRNLAAAVAVVLVLVLFLLLLVLRFERGEKRGGG